MAKPKQENKNIFLKMHPLHRIGVSLLLAAIVWLLLLHTHYGLFFKAICSWCAFAFCFIAISWVVFFTRKVSQLKAYAKEEDGSRGFVIFITLLAAFAAMVTVLLLVIYSGNDMKEQMINIPVCFFSILLSWTMVHSILTFHYAHVYYGDDKAGVKMHKEGLNFPNEPAPDYLDFAYFSFVIGMTFQVSDVEVTDKTMRRLVLLHGLISFALNTFVVALTINFIAGLTK